METNSTNEVTAKPGRGRRFLRFVGKAFLVLFLVIAVAGTVAHFAWKYSGDNKWEKIGERNGVTMYSMKTPGSSIEKFKAVWKIKTDLNRFVMWVNDTKTDAMKKNTGLHDLKILGSEGDKVTYSSYKQPLVDFLDVREFVIKTELSQDPKTKVLYYTVTGVPDRVPPNDCCVRIEVMNNRWTLTPTRNGEVEVEWYCDMDLGGAVPYVLQNKVMPEGMYNFAPKVQGFVDRDKYKNAKYDWVQEPVLN